MKDLCLIALLLVVVFPSNSAHSKSSQPQSVNETEQELRNLTRKLDDALVSKDFDILGSILSDHYTFIGVPKENYFGMLKAYDTTYEYFKSDIRRVGIYDDIAVVFGLLTHRGGSRGVAPYTSTVSFMDVWAKLDGRWQCVSSRLGDAEDASSKKEEIRFGPELKASLVVYFKTDVTEKQITRFFGDLQLGLALKHRLLKGENEFCDYLRVYPALQNHERVALTFCEGAAKMDRDVIRETIKSSPLVYKMLENIAPVEVRSINE
jgi:hypothetical protein